MSKASINEDKLTEVFELLIKEGQSDYIGEELTQIEHMIQAAQIAQSKNYEPEVVVACLLHDMGHLIEGEKMGNLGILNHEVVGSTYLKSKGFNETVCDLVQSHVNCKRYLVATSSSEYKVSDASLQTLEYQGGKMNADEIKKFKDHPNYTQRLKVRECDELSKDPTRKCANLEQFREICLTMMD